MLRLLTLIAVPIFFLFSCGSNEPAIMGGYNYPTSVAAKDSNFSFLPLIDSFTVRDSFRIAIGSAVNTVFHEPNLSIGPLERPVYRLVYEGWQRPTVVISCYPQELIVKIGGSNYFDNKALHLTNLNSMEKLHYGLLEREFPIDHRDRYPDWKRRYLDSLTMTFPALLDPHYYATLKRKVLILNDTFSYTTRRIPLTTAQYRSFENDLLASGYWSMPWEVNCSDPRLMELVLFLRPTQKINTIA